MRARTTKYFFKEALISLKRNRWMSIASIGAVAAALIIFGSFLLLSLNFDHILMDVESQVEITAYLEEDAGEDDVARITTKLAAIGGIKEIDFIPKEDALEEFKGQIGKEVFEGMENPLPDAFRIKVEVPQQVGEVAQRVAKLSGVDQVKYGKDVVEKLFKIIQWFRMIGFVVMGIFGAVSVFIISNTIRLTVFARRREINIMKYIGATDWFVRWPFLIEGMVLGFIGSSVAIGVLAFAYNYMYTAVRLNIPMISMLPMTDFYDYAWGFLLIGAVIGAFGSSFSIKRFLRV